MLCSKLWNGLGDPLLKNSSRYTYETEKDFNQLRKKIRAIEQDLSVSSATKLISSSATDNKDVKDVKQMQQSTADSNSTNQKLHGLLQQMKLLRERGWMALKINLKKQLLSQPSPVLPRYQPLHLHTEVSHLKVEVGHTVVNITFVNVNIDKEGPFSNNNSQPLIKSQRLFRLHLAPTKRQTIVYIL